MFEGTYECCRLSADEAGKLIRDCMDGAGYLDSQIHIRNTATILSSMCGRKIPAIEKPKLLPPDRDHNYIVIRLAHGVIRTRARPDVGLLDLEFLLVNYFHPNSPSLEDGDDQ